MQRTWVAGLLVNACLLVTVCWAGNFTIGRLEWLERDGRICGLGTISPGADGTEAFPYSYESMYDASNSNCLQGDSALPFCVAGSRESLDRGGRFLQRSAVDLWPIDARAGHVDLWIDFPVRLPFHFCQRSIHYFV